MKVNTSQLEIDKLRKQIASLQQKILVKDDKIASQHEKIKSLSSILDQYKKHRFGSKSEAIHPGQGTLSMSLKHRLKIKNRMLRSKLVAIRRKNPEKKRYQILSPVKKMLLMLAPRISCALVAVK